MGGEGRDAGQALAPPPVALDLAMSKLRRPTPPPGAVLRSGLLERLSGEDPRPIVSVVAPAGYGKTTLLSQWAEIDERPFAWVSVDSRDNDGKVLLRYVAEALSRVEPLGEQVFAALSSPTSSVPGSVVPRLCRAFARRTVPVVLVVDDVHFLHDAECRGALSVLAESVPAGSQLVLAGRNDPPLRLARLRAGDLVTEVGVPDLALSRLEAGALLRAADVTLAPAEVAALNEKVEGWPVGLYLAALYLREGGSLETASAAFGGDDRLVSDYIESELLDEVPAPQREFLIRSSALEQMSAALCHAALDLPDAASTLAELARSNLLLVPLDRRGQWYRYHHLFGDMLRAELDRREPGVMSAVRRRAADWCLANDQPEEAVEYSIRAQDTEKAALLVEQIGFSVYWHGRRDRLDRWIRWLEDRDAIRAHPMIAVIARFLCLSTLRQREAERWAGLLDRWQYAESDWAGDRAAEAYAAMLRASVCRGGAEQMRADVDEAVRKFAAEGMETPNLVVYRGLVHLLAGERDRADTLFEAAVDASERDDLQEILVCSLYERAALAMARGDWPAARQFADRLDRALRKPGGAEEVFVWIVRSRVAAHDGEPAAARALARAQSLRPLIPMPVFAVQNRLEIARAYLDAGDVHGARTVMGETDELLVQHPGLGILVDEADAVRTQLAHHEAAGTGGPSTLTTAELRLLPMLCTHLTTPEIADQLFLSPHTVRSQVKSIYRKLDASSRRDAVARAQELHLLG